jgi:hypothetical protein
MCQSKLSFLGGLYVVVHFSIGAPERKLNVNVKVVDELWWGRLQSFARQKLYTKPQIECKI